MTDIKFRAWDNFNKKWLMGYDHGNLGGFSLTGECVLFGEWGSCFDTFLFEREGKSPKDLIIMQYIGLKDKNGKEIYEGDIIRYPDLNKVRLYNLRNIRPTESEKEDMYLIGEVVINDGCTWLRNNGSMYCIAWMMTPTGNPHEVTLTTQHLEKVGNIYQNPELLEPK